MPLQPKENKPDTIESSKAKKPARRGSSESDCEQAPLKQTPPTSVEAEYVIPENIVVLSDDGVLCNWSRGLSPAKVGTPLPPEIAARVVNLPRSQPEEDGALADDEGD